VGGSDHGTGSRDNPGTGIFGVADLCARWDSRRFEPEFESVSRIFKKAGTRFATLWSCRVAEGVGFEPAGDVAEHIDIQEVERDLKSGSSCNSPRNAGNDCPTLSEVVSLWPKLSEESRRVILRVASSLQEGGES